MATKISSPVLQNAQSRIAQLGTLGADLTTAINQRGTRVIFSSLISGGFTLNVINTIFVDPHLQDPNSFDLLVCTLAHECSHVQQGYWVDSVQQELVAYQTEARMADTLNYDYGKQLFGKFLALDPTNPQNLDTALQYILDLAGGSVPTQTIYKSLPKFQPTGAADNMKAALAQLSAAGIAGIQALRQLKSESSR
jgi:hypothetical protein